MLGYITVITIGTILLMLPVSTTADRTTTLLDALFTATSATAVTGLTVVNTAEHWTRFGQTVLMILIQIGGFGFMTTTTILFFIFGRRFSLRQRLIIMEELNYNKIAGTIGLTRYIIILTFTTELIGGALLFLSFQKIMPTVQAIYFSVFHAISAFNNAGFDLFGSSLEQFVTSPYLNLVISSLFIFGGLGFIVIEEVYYKKRFKQLSLHSKLILSITLSLILFSTLIIFLLEYDNTATIGNLSLQNKILAAFFQGVTPRTAGFNTIPIGELKDATLFYIIILMFIGASPGSTGGGVKTSTIGTLLVVVYNMAAKKEDIEIFKRRLKQKDIYKALTVVVISLFIIAVIVIVLSLSEQAAFIRIVFEVFSAFGTVGLSTGITDNLSAVGRFLIILTMFIGRVGPFTIALAIGRRFNNSIRYPEDDILIG